MIGRIPRVLLGAVWLTALTAVRADGLEDTARLARAGASELALSEIDRQQPAYGKDPVAWLRWEDQRLYILQSLQDWPAIVRHGQQLPEGVPVSFRNKALTLVADARLSLDEPPQARSVYRQLLWHPNPGVTARDQQRWREGIIRSYLAEGLLDDAETAIRRYRQDYPEQDDKVLPWMAEVLLQQGRFKEVLSLRTGTRDPDLQPVFELAALRLSSDQSAELCQRARQYLANDAKVSYPQWVVFAEAAAVEQDPRLRAETLEQALTRRPRGRTSPVFTLSGDQLWQAYLDYGHAYGNEQQLLIGDDQAWFLQATEQMPADALLARALFAVLAFEAADQEQRELAHQYLVKLLDDSDVKGRLLQALYLNNPRFPSKAAIPLAARYRLVDQALAGGDIALASELMQSLDQPPLGKQAWSWQLRRARVMILGDAIDRGVSLLQQLTAQPIEEPEAVDALLQVVFDLQKVSHHREALAIFARLQAMPLDSRHRRELYFWMAESYTALDEPRAAARAYLESAILEDERAMDPWAQTARYHAAKSLAAAGLQDDARALLEQLLRVTQDDSRKAVLRQELLQLDGRR